MVSQVGGIAVTKLDKWGLLAWTGRFILPIEYRNIMQGASGFLSVQVEGGKWGIMTESGEWSVEPEFEHLEGFDENGLAIFRQGDKYGLINWNGDVHLEPSYAALFSAAGMYFGPRGEIQHLFDVHGKVLAERRTSWMSFTGDWTRVPYFNEDANKYGYFSIADRSEIAPAFDEVGSFAGGLAVVKRENEYSFIDRSGESIPTLECDCLRPFSNGLSAFELNGRWGFLSSPTSVCLLPKYASVYNFNEGMAVVCEGGDWRCIYPNGEPVFAQRFTSVEPFEPNGLARVQIEGKNCVINRTGRLVWKDQE